MKKDFTFQIQFMRFDPITISKSLHWNFTGLYATVSCKIYAAHRRFTFHVTEQLSVLWSSFEKNEKV